jgi:hypothetical protein
MTTNDFTQTALAITFTALLFLSCGPVAEQAGVTGAEPVADQDAGAGTVFRVPAWPGDPAPAIEVVEWLEPGDFGDRAGDIDWGDGITVATLFATWCPASRAILPAHARLQRELAGKGVRVAALFAEDADEIHHHTSHLEIDGLAVGRVASLDAFDGYLPASGVRKVPFAAIVGPDDRGRPIVLWRGPGFDPGGDPGGGFGETLGAVIDGTFDLAAAVEETEKLSGCEAELDRLGGPFEMAWKEKHLLDLGRLAAELAAAAELPGCRETVITALNDAAWTLLVDESPSVGQFQAALEISKQAIETGGAHRPAALDTYARALFENGHFEEAFHAQHKAVEMLREDGNEAPDEYLEPLDRYAVVACARKNVVACQISHRPRKGAAKGEKAEKKKIPNQVSKARAVADLRALHDFLRDRYAGYDDTAATLAAVGSSWDERTSEFEERIGEKRRWPREDLKQLLADFLLVTGDRHMMVGLDYRFRDAVNPVLSAGPYFADGRVSLREGRFWLHVPGKPALDIALSGVEPIGSPRDVELGRPYLYPTLPEPAAGDRPEDEYLLGVLARESDAPEQIEVSATNRDGTSRELTLAVHRGRTVYTEALGSRHWRLYRGGLPTLRVHALWGDVSEMPLSAVELRERDAVLLDLRGNEGGADSFAIEWCTRFSRQSFQLYTGFAAFHSGQEDLLDRWSCELLLELPQAAAGSSAMPDEPYGGVLVVLVDAATASSGESFTALASQIPGALVVGENTAGAITYGNVDQSVELPYSKLWVRGGRTKFVTAGREVRETIGAFPDYWLDTNSPEQDVAQYLTLTEHTSAPSP